MCKYRQDDDQEDQYQTRAYQIMTRRMLVHDFKLWRLELV